MVAASCGAPAKPRTEARPLDPVEHLISILEHGEAVYGLGTGCEEWRAKPGPTEVILTPDNDEDEDGSQPDAAAESDEEPVTEADKEPVAEPAAAARPPRIEGHLEAGAPDAEGRLYHFSYVVMRDSGRVRLERSGRGWTPAPGRVVPVPGKPGWGYISSTNYCLFKVDVRAAPDGKAVLVGDETWFLSREACMAQGVVIADRGCPKPKPQPR